MTAADLIRQLGELPSDAEIAVTGFDGWGFDSVRNISKVSARRCTSKSSVAPDWDTEESSETTGETVQVIVLL